MPKELLLFRGAERVCPDGSNWKLTGKKEKEKEKEEGLFLYLKADQGR